MNVCVRVCALLHVCDWIHMSICLLLSKCWHESKRQMAGGRHSHIDGRDGEADRESDDRRVSWLADMDIPLFSMAWIRLTRDGGAVSGGVNCSLRSGTETAETTTQITVTLLAQSLPKDHGGAAALTRAQLTRSSWRYRACIML